MAWLYNKRKPLLEINFEKGYITKIISVKEENAHLLPIILYDPEGPVPEQGRLTLKNVNRWLETRKIPEKREGLKKARMQFRQFDTQVNMFSLSDQYWIKHRESETWDRLNYFTNAYSQEQGKIFFEPWNANLYDAIHKPGPDLTTNGVLRKRWVQEEDLHSCLLKAGSEKYHQEPLSEVLGSLVMKKLNIMKFVEYTLTISGIYFCSKCANFVTASTEFVPASHINTLVKRREDEEPYDHFIDMCDRYGIVGAREYMDKMIAVDHILHNTDRHMGNFGFIRNAENGEILGFAPLFDFGRCYFGYGAAQDLTSRFFGKMEKSCYRKLLKQKELPALDVGPLKRLVDDYPDISDDASDLIMCLLDEAADEIEKGRPKNRILDGPELA